MPADIQMPVAPHGFSHGFDPEHTYNKPQVIGQREAYEPSSVEWFRRVLKSTMPLNSRSIVCLRPRIS